MRLNHDERFTEAQQERIREAVIEGQRKWREMSVEAAASKLEDVILAELTRPAIGPDVVVMNSVGTAVAFMRQFSGHGSYTPLIPVPDAREIAWQAIRRLVEQGNCTDNAMAEVDRDLAAYTRGEP